MNASVAFRWLHAEEILLGRKQFETVVSRRARKPGQSVTSRAPAFQFHNASHLELRHNVPARGHTSPEENRPRGPCHEG